MKKLVAFAVLASAFVIGFGALKPAPKVVILNSAGTILLGMTNAFDQAFQIEGSSDLRNWQRIQSGLPAGSKVNWPVEKTDEPRFFRVVFGDAPYQPLTASVRPTRVVAKTGGTTAIRGDITGSKPWLISWHKDGVPIANQTNISLVLSNLQTVDAGLYTCAIDNFGSQIVTDPVEVLVLSESSPAPASLKGITITVEISGGQAPYQSSGIQLIRFHSIENTYSIISSSAAWNSQGTYSYEITGEKTADLRLEDSIAGSGRGVITFTKAREGILRIDASSGAGWMEGSIHLD